MDKGIVVKILKDFVSSKSYLLILLFVLCACIVFTSYNSPILDYISNINYSFVEHKNLYTFILHPVIIIFTISLYNKVSKNPMILLRLKNKKEYYKIQLKSSILLVTIFFLQLLLIVLISINLNRNIEFSIINDDYYDTLNILVLFVNLFKIYLNFIVLQFITIIFINIFRNKNLSLLLSFLYVLYLHASYKFEMIPFIKYFIPSVHLYSYAVYDNLLISFISSLIYYIVCISILYFVCKRIVINKSVERELIL